MRLVSEDGKRAITDEAVFAIPAYELQPSDDGMNWIGLRVGVFRREEDALSWIECGEPAPMRMPWWRS